MRELAGDGLEEREYGKEPLRRAEILAIVTAAGSVAAVLNARHATAKANGWKERPPSPAAFAAAAVAEPNLLRRPITVRDGRAVVGRDETALRALLA